MKAAVIGYPVAHSKSPLIHEYWLKKYNITGSYEAIAAEPENLNAVIHNLEQQGYNGFNVTVPHKEAVLELCDHLDDTARSIGAVNTILIKDKKLHGMNTDAFGFIENLKSCQHDFDFNGMTAFVLGAGGASKAVIYALIEEGVKKIYLSNRTIEKAETLAQKFSPFVEVISWDEKENFLKHSNLLVNTTFLGMTGKPDLEIDIHTLPQTSLVTDIVYFPLMTDLLKNAQAQNLHIVTGIGMLLHQARPAFQAWSGILPDIDATLEAQVLA